MRQRHKQHQPHIRHRRFPVNERLERKGENYRRPPAGALVAHSLAPCEEKQRDQRRRDSRRKPRGEIVLAKESIARDLKPVSQRRFIESELVVEVRNNVVSAFAHFPCCFGETRLVPIDQRQVPCPKDVKSDAGNEQQRIIADTDFRRVLAIYRSCVTQLADSRIPGG